MCSARVRVESMNQKCQWSTFHRPLTDQRALVSEINSTLEAAAIKLNSYTNHKVPESHLVELQSSVFSPLRPQSDFSTVRTERRLVVRPRSCSCGPIRGRGGRTRLTLYPTSSSLFITQPSFHLCNSCTAAIKTPH